jgi:hypothetical protein
MENWEDLFKQREKDELGQYIPENKKFAKSQNLSNDVDQDAGQAVLKKKFNKLRHKALYINLEYEETDEIFNLARANFISSMFQFCHDNKIEPPFDSHKTEESENSDSELDSSEVKELYREIVKNTHPDMLSGLSEDEIEERAELYRQAVEGKKEGDFEKILRVALELDINIKNLTSEYLNEIENAINKMESEINKMKKDIMYQWYYCSSNQQKDIFKHITKDQKKVE